MAGTDHEGNDIKIDAGKPIQAYLARPAGPAKAAVIVIHEVWGLVGHVRSVADRLADEGYLALAPDLLSEAVDVGALGGLQEGLFDPERRNRVQPELRRLMAPIHDPGFGKRTTAALKGCFDYLYGLPESRGKVAVIGFCFGGTYSFNLAVEEPRLMLALPFYGHADQDAATLKNIKCPVRAFYGENDESLVAGLDDLRQRMKDAGVDFAAKVYPDCGHAFFNDTNRFAYDEAAAKDAWRIALGELDKAAA